MIDQERWQSLALAMQRARNRSAVNSIAWRQWEDARVATQGNADSYNQNITIEKGLLVNGYDNANYLAGDIPGELLLAKNAGAEWVRADLWWYSIQPTSTVFQWDYFDLYVNTAVGLGLKVIPILQGTPSWAGATLISPPNMTYWNRFVGAAVDRYKDRVSVWEIWNEPDSSLRWRGAPSQYAQLLYKAASAIRFVDPNAKIWLGGLANGGPINPNFLQDILQDNINPAARNFDVTNIHTNFHDMAGITNLIKSTKDKVSVYGFKPLVVTESSYTSDPEFQRYAQYSGGQTGQASYLTDSFNTMNAEGVQVGVWANLTDYLNPGDEYASTGVYDINRDPKLSRAAFLAV